MAEPLPGTSKDEISDTSEDDVQSAVVVKQDTCIPWSNQQHTELTTIVPIKRSCLTFLDPYFGILIKENTLGINNCVTERHCLSIIESDFAALVLSGDKQIVRNGRVVNSFKVSAGNKNQCVLKTTDAQKRRMNYLSHISKQHSSIMKSKHIAYGRSSSQRAVLKQSVLNFVVSNEWFAPQKSVLTFFPGPENVNDDDDEIVTWMGLKPCIDGNLYPPRKLTPSVCTSDTNITTSGFKSLVRSSLPKEIPSKALDVPVMLKTWKHDTSSNILWKSAAIKSFGQKKLALQQTCSATDDITMNDLAGYFDNLVHIPKEMSSMAKMMYQ